MSKTPKRAKSATSPPTEPPHVIAQLEHGLVAVYKPAGLAVHAAPGVTEDLTTWAQTNLGPDAQVGHRLDRETSGVLLMTLAPELRPVVSGWMEAGRLGKTYLALVHGRARSKGIIRRPLADGRRGRTLDAVTRYWVEERLGGFTLVKVSPETGRKHQIRRHFQGIGHALVGDARYPTRGFRPVPAFPGRLWLHATRLELPDGSLIECPLPAALEDHLRVLRERSPDRGPAKPPTAPGEP
jgi:23S rRNA-/tRNA-specific pseudouridylate synthase